MGTLGNWLNRNSVEGNTAQYSTLDFSQVAPGYFVFIPTQGSAWGFNLTGPFLYREVTGNFIVSTRVNARTISANSSPTSQYNYAGIMARTLTSVGAGNQNWVDIQLGMHGPGTGGAPVVGWETDSVVNNIRTGYFNNAATSGSVRICRIGNTFTTYLSYDNEASWTQVGSFIRSDILADSTMQVGMTVSAFVAPAVLRGDFDYIRFAYPNSQADCTMAI